MTAVTATDPNAGFHAQSGGRRRGLARVADLRIGVRLAALGAVLCAVLLGVGIYTISALGTVSGQAQSINTNGIVHPNNLHLARSSMLEARMDFVKVVVAADEHKDTAAAIATLQQADQSVDQPFNEYRSTLDPVSSTDASKRAAMTDAANNLAAWRNQKDIMLASVAKGNGAGAYAAMVAAAPYGAKVGADLDAAVASENAEAKGTAAHVQSISNSTRTMAIGLLVGGVVLAAALIVLTTLGITRPLRKAVTVLDAVGDGDFTGRIGVDSKDEIGQMSEPPLES
ncbi:MCP four helix bundle domain-containing protein [Acidiferrimicrobium sp. IK]|uniref:MCP four helix bundle domain-containing protein n=1 Tax=Acidiferrimicrobium sp. IK TaxID=2871700 RepID=UPI0021CAFED5|nr:MCP four helix bundle domain-containing protein [Acidiferrimicrobium sp. IK]MCU4184241.1 MCP four helix bundle domain-containing protein [Acidiferrimicrobium sp. IK]